MTVKGNRVQILLKLSRLIDAFNTRMGRFVAWFLLVAVVISAVNAIIRKMFNMSSNGWLESQWMLFGAVFLLCAPWTLIANEHIRIDILSARLSQKKRHWIDVCGHVFFLMPFCIVMLITSWPFFTRSAPSLDPVQILFASTSLFDFFPSVLRLGEQSQNAGGLPQWPAKFLVFLGFLALFVQAISELIKRVAIMNGVIEDLNSGGGHHDTVKAEAQRLLDAVAQDAKNAQITPSIVASEARS